MKTPLLLFAALSFTAMVPVGGQGQRPPTAEEILRLVRWSQAANAQDFSGHIRPRRVSLKHIPLKLTMDAKEVRFVFYKDDKRRNGNEEQIIVLKLLENRYELQEILRGQAPRRLPAARFAQKIRDTDITYEDMAMRFLYWPKPVILGVERAKGGDSWKVRCTNPLRDGAYATVDLWVSQRSGALVKMRGYNVAGKLVKSYEVERVQRHNGAWVLEQMNVRSHDPARAGRVISSTYLEIEPPS